MLTKGCSQCFHDCKAAKPRVVIDHRSVGDILEHTSVRVVLDHTSVRVILDHSPVGVAADNSSVGLVVDHSSAGVQDQADEWVEQLIDCNQSPQNWDWETLRTQVK